MDGTGRVVPVKRPPSCVGSCDQAVGMMERNKGIMLGMDQENGGREDCRRAPGSLHGRATDRPVRARHQRRATAHVKRQAAPTEHQQAAQRRKKAAYHARRAAPS